MTAANAIIRPIHDRMPVILPPAAYTRWLSPETSGDNLEAMLQPRDPRMLKAWPVGTWVNNLENDGVACLSAS